MSAIVYLSNKAAQVIKNANPEQTSSVERLTALLALQVNNCGVIVATMLIGLLTGKPLETALGIAIFVITRLLTGGFHFRNLDVCFLVSTAVLAAIPHIELSIIVMVITSLISIVITAFFPTKQKILPICIIILNVFLSSPIIALAIFFQSISLLQFRRLQL
ncbi:accessory gene regulator B family protein [Paenibacillus sp. OV219]|uniref:accessory gene regulator B family protein n=1 Tax=Paenibacillus sp. OV219 TaxID=1884377 RepID=UPI0008B0808D|nr:accessory gene regulator B family protein [Paenibacillus sp. OV219]SEN59151.1 accessory gene regulator B [Paenibacillus sp. OV219]